ncbi:MAG: DUF2269 domain-containing protein [Pyrinomonadaceae bacterium]
MTMTSGLRKFTLTAHIISSVGWLGAMVSFLALAVVGLISTDTQLVRAAYLVMNLITWFVIVPLAIASLVTGLVQSLGTSWGLFRHFWVLVKFLLTMFATIVLLLKTQLISYFAHAAANTTLSSADFARLKSPELFVHAAGGLIVLLVVTMLSVYKPWGLTAYGRRKQAEHGRSQADLTPVRTPTTTPVWSSPRETSLRTPRWVYVVGIHAIGLLLLFVVLDVTGGGLPGH